MKPKTHRPTLRQRIVADLTKRYKVMPNPRPHPDVRGKWVFVTDGVLECGGTRANMRHHRAWRIQWAATNLMVQVRELRVKGFKVTFPS